MVCLVCLFSVSHFPTGAFYYLPIHLRAPLSQPWSYRLVTLLLEKFIIIWSIIACDSFRAAYCLSMHYWTKLVVIEGFICGQIGYLDELIISQADCVMLSFIRSEMNFRLKFLQLFNCNHNM